MYSISNRRYIGNKNKLMPWISDLVHKYCKGDTFFDVFAGSGSVSNYFFNDYNEFILNDFLYSNEVIYKAFFGVGEYRQNTLDYYKNYFNDIDKNKLEENYVSVNYGNKFFNNNDAKLIGYIRSYIDDLKLKKDINEKEFNILLASLLYSMDKVANTVGHYDAYRKIKDIKEVFCYNLIDPIDTKNKTIHIYREDANTLVRNVKADIAFIDPPYNSRQYSRFYHVLENITKWEKPELYGVAMKPEEENMSDMDSKILQTNEKIKLENIQDIKKKTLYKYAEEMDKEIVFKELKNVCKGIESKHESIRYLDGPVRLEFLTSIALVQNFKGLDVNPNYSVDDEGLPTFTASGGMSDIEAYDVDYDSYYEVTLMKGRANQVNNEIIPIGRHLREIKETRRENSFSVFVAPIIHEDTREAADWQKVKYNIDILTYDIDEFIHNITKSKKASDLLLM